MDNREKTLSVTVPSYNEGKTVCNILGRILSVTLPFDIKKEIVLVDDGSEDETADSVREFIRINPEIPVKYLSLR